TGPNVTYAVNEGVLVNFTLSQPREDGTRINGELHLQWSGTQGRPVQLPARAAVAVPSAQLAVSSAQREPEAKIEHRLAALIAQMTPEQRQVFLTRLPQKTTEPDQAVPRHREVAVAGRRLPVLRRLQPAQVPRVQ